MTVYEVSGRIKFGSITGVGQVTITRARGIAPGTIAIMLPFEPEIVSDPAPLIISDETREIVFPDCIWQSREFEYNDGESVGLQLLDYRWRWEFGEISGEYNIVDGGIILPKSKKSARDLAKLLLEEMGVEKFDVMAVPNDKFPSVSWNLDNPAQALESFVNQFGCVVCPQINGKVVISKNNVGKQLPRTKGAEFRFSYKKASIPDEIRISAQPTQWEISIEIDKPFGLEREQPNPLKPTSESIVPIDKLSYKPPNGWESEDPRSFPSIGTAIKADTDLKAALKERDRIRGLAEESVWKYFGFKFPFKLPGLPFEIKDINQLVFQEELLTVSEIEYESPLQGRLVEVKRQQPFVYGQFYDYNGYGRNNVDAFSHDYDTDKKLIYRGSFSVDKRRGIITFGDAMFLYDAAAETNKMITPPKLFLRTCVSVRDPETGKLWRDVYVQPTGIKHKTKPKWLQGDLYRQINVSPKTKKPFKDGDNKAKLEEELKLFLDIEVKRLQVLKPQTGVYPYFLDIELDGTIQQVTYDIDSNGFCQTTASYGMEHSAIYPNYEERMKVMRTDAFIQKQAQLRQGGQNDA